MKRIQNVLMVAIIMVAFSGAAMAQNNGNVRNEKLNREQLAEKQAKYIAQQLAFDESITKKFVETYLLSQKEVWSLEPIRKSNNISEMSEEEIGQINKARFGRSQKMLDIRQKYYSEYSKFLTQKQIFRVYQLEKNSLDHLKNHKEGKAGMHKQGAKRQH